MDYKYIKKILEKYFEGDTSLDEENTLYEYFTSSNDIPKELLYAKAMFSHFKKEKSISYPRNRQQKSYTKWITIAASVLLFAGWLTYYTTSTTTKIYGYINGEAITDASIAQEEMNSALLIIAQKFNKGTNKLESLSKFQETSKIITLKTTK